MTMGLTAPVSLPREEGHDLCYRSESLENAVAQSDFRLFAVSGKSAGLWVEGLKDWRYSIMPPVRCAVGSSRREECYRYRNAAKILMVTLGRVLKILGANDNGGAMMRRPFWWSADLLDLAKAAATGSASSDSR